MLPILLKDGYKASHKNQYPKGTEIVYSNFTPRSNKHGIADKLVVFGIQAFIKKYLIEDFNTNFFKRSKEEVLKEYKSTMDEYLFCDYDVSHIAELHDLGYLPLVIKALPEGSRVKMGVPVLTIYNTDSRFFWLTNFLETLLSCELWLPMTSATTAKTYRDLFSEFADKTGGDKGFVQFQGHDFSMRGMGGVGASLLSGMAHLTSFVGTDTIPAIVEAKKYYGATGLVGCSVAATEHSVMSLGNKESEQETFRRLVEDIYPSGIISIVSDTWDLWKVLTEYLPNLKDKVMTRNGKCVVRPDSGNPTEIICGKKINIFKDHFDASNYFKNNISDRNIYKVDKEYFKVIIHNDIEFKYESYTVKPEDKGVIELLWDTFGGTINEKGFKVLDTHVGAIYGDSITIKIAKDILKGLEAKGFASTNLVFGIGSFTYTFVSRDTYGFALKATWGQVNGEAREIFKDPITDNGLKKSAKGLLRVDLVEGEYVLKDQCTREEEQGGCLGIVFLDSLLVKETTFQEIRDRLWK